MRLMVMRRVLDLLLGENDRDSVTRRLRNSIASHRSRVPVARSGRIQSELTSMFGRRPKSEAVVRIIHAGRTRR